MYYVYLHKRNDTQEVFYVGCSIQSNEEQLKQRGNTFQGLHYRAFEKSHSRTEEWKQICNTVGYTVEIVFYSDFKEEALKKEEELISLYKETLVNITNGGLGVKGLVHSEETKKQISEKLKGVAKSEEHAKRINDAKLKPIRMIKDDGSYIDFSSAKDACVFLDNPNAFSNISKCLRGIREKAYGCRWQYM